MKRLLSEALQRATSVEKVNIEVPERPEHGDYATNVAMILAKEKATNPKDLAEDLVKKLKKDKNLLKIVDKIEVAGPGFINFWLAVTELAANITTVLKDGDKHGASDSLRGKKVMVEYAHPNTHKEMHIGHMRTLIVGESLARILEANAAEVFRANYQGDIGPHVAKAIWGTQKLLKKKNMSWDIAEKMALAEKAHLLGEGYVLGNNEYEANSGEIDELNKKLYRKDEEIMPIYRQTRRWSLDYYEELYKRFGTKFDKLYFESEAADLGKGTVLKNLSKVFIESEGAIIFDAEKYGLHKRVFITKEGNPTYEGKEMGLVQMQLTDFNFDKIIHITAHEQSGYFQVVFKASEELFPELKGKQEHIPMGMVQLVGAKMSSRTGVLITVDGLLDEVKVQLKPLVVNEELTESEKEDVLEKGTIAAVKYSVLNTSVTQDVIFDIKKSVSLSGNSGPYIQYTYARIRSVLLKSHGEEKPEPKRVRKYAVKQDIVIRVKEPVHHAAAEATYNYNKEELALLRAFIHFPEVIQLASKNYAPNLLCNYLYDLASKFNTFYARHKIINNERSENKGLRDNQHRILNVEPDKENPGMEKSIVAFRLILTTATGQILKNGLDILGIETPERM